MNDQDINIELELAIAEKQAQEAQAQHQLMVQKLQQLKTEQERRLNDPKERAKMFNNANNLIDSGVKEYESKGYSCLVQRDENGLIKKITFKSGKYKKSGVQGKQRSANQNVSIPAMTSEQFAQIYPSLAQQFNNQDIISKLLECFGGVGINKFRTQPVLGNILADGYDGIKIEKIGTKGRGVYYKKVII
jgi:hypothetical protein